MKSFVVFVAVIALASCAVIPKPSLRDEDILDSQEEAEEAVSRKHHASFVTGLGFVSHNSPMWNAVKDLDSEELADFVAQLHSLHAENIDEEPEQKQEDEDTDGTMSRKAHHQVSFVTGLGFVSHNSPMWNAVKDLDSEELADFVAQLHSLHAENVDDEPEQEQEEGEIDGTLARKAHHQVSFVTGLGFVSHNSPMWNAVKDLDSEELADFVAQLHSLHAENAYDELEQEQEEGEIDVTLARKVHHQVSFVTGLGFVSHNSPMWNAVKDLDSEELAQFVAELQGLHSETNVEELEGEQEEEETNAVNRDETTEDEQAEEQINEQTSRKGLRPFIALGLLSHHRPVSHVVEELDSVEVTELAVELRRLLGENENEDTEVEQEEGELKYLTWTRPQNAYGEIVPGLGFVNYHNPLWSIISQLNSDELEEFVLYLHNHKPSEEDEVAEISSQEQSSSAEVVNEDTDDTMTINVNEQSNFDDLAESTDVSNNEQPVSVDILGEYTENSETINDEEESTNNELAETTDISNNEQPTLVDVANEDTAPTIDNGESNMDDLDELPLIFSSEQPAPVDVLGEDTEDSETINEESIDDDLAEISDLSNNEQPTPVFTVNEDTEDAVTIDDNGESTIDDLAESTLIYSSEQDAQGDIVDEDIENTEATDDDRD